MDNTFQLLDEAGRVDFFRLIMQSIGHYSYICLWSYFRHPYNCLCFLDGLFYEENNQPSSSSGSKARRLFDEYRQEAFFVETERVPGIAFKNSLPYVEIQELELQKLASTEAQRQFYQEARIKKAIFMGCRSGEIEIGFANVSQVDIEKEMRSLFPRDFSPQICPIREPFWRSDQNPPSSSSSISLRSPSTDSPEYSSLLFNIPSNAHFPETPSEVPSFFQIPITPSPYQEAMQTFARARNIPFLTPEIENAAVAKAFLAVLSSSPSSLSHQPQQNNLPYNHRVISKSSAFKSYVSALRPTTQIRANLGRQSMLKRSIAFVRSLNSLRVQDQRLQATRLTSTQLHHMISERKRREKLNESFQALKSLLPSGTKKDKASLLTTTREYLSSLKAQIAELTRRNQLLTAQLLPAEEAINVEETSSSNERLGIRIISHVLDSTIEERIVELRVTVRGECPMEDILIRILEFLEQVENLSLVSMESSTGQMIELISSTRINLTLRIEVNELWDEAGFREAVRRVIADLAP
ncbi:hypothetical protein F2P56_022826 [Juglans regia]|uniref:BHLH domain-containing protein n=2 Tax=Juglans regia TaxID=51240 RepID=A0A833U013_JUGRE|nr:putative transcription factor bHLH041 [Juglans regia]KAF5458825.1 hypothetical protein F2P56_022826 [Juglans regia]